MRITSGIARGISLEAPKGNSTRPATDASRQAVFSSLGDSVCGANVLDVFAGTGSYGLEAASRGASKITFVENERLAIKCLERNASRVEKVLASNGATASFNILRTNCLNAFDTQRRQNFDIIFADPPYEMLSNAEALSKILNLFAQVSGQDSLLILEAPAEFEMPAETSDGKFAFKVLKRLGKKSKGKPSHLIFRVQKI